MNRFIAVMASLVLVVLAGAACTKKDNAKVAASDDHAHSDAKATKAGVDHGEEVVLGTVSLGGFEFAVSRQGALAPGVDTGLEVRVSKAPAGRDWRTLNLYLWIEDVGGNKLNAPAKATAEKDRLHAHAAIPAKTTQRPAALVLRLRDGTTDVRARISLGGSPTPAVAPTDHGHAHAETPHQGLVAALTAADGRTVAGWVELKLHADKGDLELWVGLDKTLERPLDLPLDAAVTVRFVDHGKREVALAPRNRDNNEDEQGVENVRDGKTNYFIYPGATGADASWLKGKAFQSIVTVSIKAGDRTLTAKEFVLRPHSH